MVHPPDRGHKTHHRPNHGYRGYLQYMKDEGKGKVNQLRSPNWVEKQLDG